jgi:hypothetical protein
MEERLVEGTARERRSRWSKADQEENPFESAATAAIRSLLTHHAFRGTPRGRQRDLWRARSPAWVRRCPARARVPRPGFCCRGGGTPRRPAPLDVLR